MKGLLQIGDLARLGGVSVKALRFYDDQGLLRPEHVDPQTGYRYYTIDQAATLAMITNLRLVDFSIAEIGELLNAGGAVDFSGAIAEKQKSLETERNRLVDKIKIADILAQFSSGAADPPPSLKLTPQEPQRVYSIRRTVPHLGEPVTEMFETAETHVGEENARAARPPFLIFHDPPDQKNQLTVETCIPVADDTPLADPVKIIPGAELVCAVVYEGSYLNTAALYHQMRGWIDHAGLEPAGPLREVYHRFGAGQEDYRLPARVTAKNSRDYLTELQIPLQMNFNK